MIWKLMKKKMKEKIIKIILYKKKKKIIAYINAIKYYSHLTSVHVKLYY